MNRGHLDGRDRPHRDVETDGGETEESKQAEKRGDRATPSREVSHDFPPQESSPHDDSQDQ